MHPLVGYSPDHFRPNARNNCPQATLTWDKQLTPQKDSQHYSLGIKTVSKREGFH